MLDISIPQVTAKFKSEDTILKFMKDHVTIEAKTDGVKLTLVKISDTGTLDDWIVSYKGSVFYRGEFSYQDELGKNSTIGNSQFDKVFDHLEKLHLSDYSSIPNYTEFFLEFLVHKNTVMSEYTKTGTMILLGYGKANPEVRFGKLKTGSDKFETAKNATFAKQLKVITPPVLFAGKLFPTDDLLKGVHNKILRQAIWDKMLTFKSLETAPKMYFNMLVQTCIGLESEFGGKEEGIVFHHNGNLYKAQQSYQLDKTARSSKKLRWMEDDPVKEQYYWDDVIDVSHRIASSIRTQDIQQGLKEIAQKVQQLNFEGVHSKKNTASVMDDVQLNAKNFYLKSLKGNNGGLVIGKFRVLTTGHVRMIMRAMHECDEVVIGCVTGSKTETSKDLRLKALRKTFPKLKVIELVSGNLFTALKKAEININHIYAGSDRVEEYERMLLKAPGINVKEIERSGADISATKVLEHLDNINYFNQNTPREIHDLYDEYVEQYRPDLEEANG